jgi:small-conductance mechanosensitive channel
MKGVQRLVLGGLIALLLVVLAAVIYTRSWSNYRDRLRAIRVASHHPSQIVDTHALETAQQLAPLAETHTEQEYAQEALRIADHSVDLAFSAALVDAEENPAPLTPQTREITARIKTGETNLAADQDLVAALTGKVAKARPAAKEALQEQLDLANAQLELDQDEIDDAHQDLIRAGGDKHATVQNLLDQHEASEQHTGKASAPAPGSAAPSPELTKSRSLTPNIQAWLSLRAKEKLLLQAQQNALARQANLSASHQALEKEVNEEKAQKQILHHKPKVSLQPSNSPPANATAQPPSQLTFLQELTQDQKTLSQLGKRIQDEQQLAALYGNWIAFVKVREHAFLHEILLAIFWVLLIAVCVLAANQLIHRFFSELPPEARQLHTVRAAILISLQVLGVILVLLVAFGVPSNFGTILALAGAGFTVAMRDFILGFAGWFVLMGKDGIRPGDWVEINGVGGEVLEVGPFRTVLLETGNWSDAAHPTGRKVTFVNSFAIEGHYFNFSTSGQWLWDELQVLVPSESDPYSIAEAIQKIVADDTTANAKLAEKEWQRVVPAFSKQTFSAAPSMGVRPTAVGVNVQVRYLTRARERQEVRSRLYRAVVELLHQKNVPESAAAGISKPAERK